MPSSEQDLARRKTRTAAVLVAVIAVLLLLPLAVAMGWLGGGNASVRIAFLPFAAPGGDAEIEATASAVGRSLHARFQERGDARLTLLAPTAASGYEGRDLLPVQVGRNLRADVVVAGQVRRETASAGGGAAVSAQVVRVEDGRALWTGRWRIQDPSAAGDRRATLDWLEDRVGKTLRTVRASP